MVGGIGGKKEDEAGDLLPLLYPMVAGLSANHLDGSKNPALGWEAAVIETGMAVR